jgi:hypothetical protein
MMWLLGVFANPSESQPLKSRNPAFATLANEKGGRPSIRRYRIEDTQLFITWSFRVSLLELFRCGVARFSLKFRRLPLEFLRKLEKCNFRRMSSQYNDTI